MKKRKKGINPILNWLFGEEKNIVWIIFFGVVLMLIINFVILDYGFQPENEVCNHPKTMGFVDYSQYSRFNIGNTINHETGNSELGPILIEKGMNKEDYDYYGVWCDVYDWRDMTETELLRKRCEELAYE